MAFSELTRIRRRLNLQCAGLCGKMACLPGLGGIFAAWARNLRERRIVRCEVQGSIMHLDSADRAVARIILKHGVWEPYETELFRSVLVDGMTVVDIGANVGFYSLIAAKVVGPRGKVYAFEPEPNNYDLLSRSIAANGYGNITACPVALSESAGTLRLHLDRRNYGNPSLSSKNIKSDRQGGSVEVQAATLDDYLLGTLGCQQVDLLKMDTQGAEGLIVRGGTQVFHEFHPKVFMEFWPQAMRNIGTDPQELLDTLESFGYRRQAIVKTGQSLVDVDFSDLVERCDQRDESLGAGDASVDLLLTKEG